MLTSIFSVNMLAIFSYIAFIDVLEMLSPLQSV